ncbi:hypothetical protein LguiB_032154 [Lonicera macranthoides]
MAHKEAKTREKPMDVHRSSRMEADYGKRYFLGLRQLDLTHIVRKKQRILSPGDLCDVWLMRGLYMPLGVKTERLVEGLSSRHCALSLVGEPIMYLEINALVDELHRRPISTFLLYVSVDAATEDSLKANDRPLFGDFWEQFVPRIFAYLGYCKNKCQDSLKALKEKHQ